jgi:hypothetical protein
MLVWDKYVWVGKVIRWVQLHSNELNFKDALRGRKQSGAESVIHIMHFNTLPSSFSRFQLPLITSFPQQICGK